MRFSTQLLVVRFLIIFLVTFNVSDFEVKFKFSDNVGILGTWVVNLTWEPGVTVHMHIIFPYVLLRKGA